LPEAITGENVYLTDRIRVGNDERLQESRMLEIRTSGLTRGSSGIGASRPLLSTLSSFARDNLLFRSCVFSLIRLIRVISGSILFLFSLPFIHQPSSINLHPSTFLRPLLFLFLFIIQKSKINLDLSSRQ